MPASTKVIFVRNTQPGPAVYDTKDYPSLKWAGAGDANGDDVLPLSSTILDEHGFQRALHLGVFEVIEADGAVKAKMDAHARSWQRQTQRMREITGKTLGEPDVEDGTVPTEAPKRRPAERGLPETIGTEIGVKTTRDKAIPEVVQDRVVVLTEPGYY